MIPYDLRQVARLLHSSCTQARSIKGFSIDSRQVQSGHIFFAIKGQRVDGHDFLEEVSGRGATAAVVDRGYTGPDYGMNLLRVVDVVEALQTLARHSIERHPAKIVAITGSVGKTTTKEFLLRLLLRKFRVSASKGNHNSQIGLPFTILNDLSGLEEVLVLEMGMTKPGHISQLLSIAPADVAAITSIALVHAENYDSLEHIARTKAEIFSNPRTRLGILHRDIVNYEELLQVGNCRKVSFSSHQEADYTLTRVDGQLAIGFAGENYRIEAPEMGGHLQHNLLAAVSIAHTLGLQWEQIVEVIPTLTLPERRMQVVEKMGITFVNDSYNACEDSVKAALDHMPLPKEGGRRVAILAHMPELGKFSEECHHRVGLHALERVDLLFCLGEECRPFVDIWQKREREVYHFTDRKELLSVLNAFLKPNDVALIKGANVKRMWEILDEITLSR